MNTQTGEIHTSLQAAIMAGVRPEFAMEIIPTRKQRRAMKVGRNDPCPCGSGIKFKKCHLGKPVA